MSIVGYNTKTKSVLMAKQWDLSGLVCVFLGVFPATDEGLYGERDSDGIGAYSGRGV